MGPMVSISQYFFKLWTLKIRRWCIKNWNSNFSFKISLSENMGPWLPHGLLGQPKLKSTCPFQGPLCHHPMTLDHHPDTVAKCQVPFVTMMLQLLSSNQPFWLIHVTCLAPLGTRIHDPCLKGTSEAIALSSIWRGRQILHIWVSSTAFPGEAHTMLLSRVGANSLKECPSIKKGPVGLKSS